MVRMKNSCTVFAVNPNGKRTPGRHGCTYEGNIKMSPKAADFYGVD
jgi:hypothetical protein